MSKSGEEVVRTAFLATKENLEAFENNLKKSRQEIGRELSQLYEEKVTTDEMCESILTSFHFKQNESLQEYLTSNSADGKPVWIGADEFVYYAIRYSLDFQAFQKSLTLSLLSQMCRRNMIREDELSRGLEKLFLNTDEILFDVPGAHLEVVDFVKEFIEEEYISFNFIYRLQEKHLELFTEPVFVTALERLQETKQIMKDRFVFRFFGHQSGGDFVEFDEALSDLTDLPFLHYMVHLLIIKAFEDGDGDHTLLVLKYLAKSVVITAEDVMHAVSQLINLVSELILDIPKIKIYLVNFIRRAILRNIIPYNYLRYAMRLHLGRTTGIVILQQVSADLETKMESESSKLMNENDSFESGSCEAVHNSVVRRNSDLTSCTQQSDLQRAMTRDDVEEMFEAVDRDFDTATSRMEEIIRLANLSSIGFADLVRQLVENILSKSDYDRGSARLIELLGILVSRECITRHDIVQGVSLLKTNSASLDFVTRCKEYGVLPEEFIFDS